MSFDNPRNQVRVISIADELADMTDKLDLKLTF